MLTTAEFLARLGPVNFIRAIWPTKQRGAAPDGYKDSYSFYGDYSAQAAQRLEALNRLGYSIYYGSNDPKCERFLEKNVTELRLIYRDCDTSEEPSSWKLKSGELVAPHFHYVTSPGKSQSLWLIEPIPADHCGKIHNFMHQFHGHDASTGGAARLLRLPGFHNTKYPENPLVSVVSASDAPPIAAALVLQHFGLDVKLAANVNTLMQRAQSGSGGVSTAVGGTNVVSFPAKQDKPHQGASSPELDAQRIAERLTGTKQNLDRDYLLQVLALLDPLERAEWFKVGAALHFMFDGHGDGLELFDAWSALAPQKYTHAACVKLWRDFKVDRDNPANWRSLRAMADRASLTAAVVERAAALTAFGLLMPAKLSIKVLAFQWAETMKQGDTAIVVDSGSMVNAYQAIEHLEPTLHYDEFAREERTVRGPFQDHDENILYADTKELGNRWTQADCRVAIKRYARAHRRNPALDYMIAKRDQWDGTERLATLFVRHLGAADTPFVREITQLHFIAMVRRVLKPGCKYDYLPILQGPGELGKSSLFKRLMPFDDWFSDAPDLGEDAKRFYPAIQGKLCIEFAELSGKSKNDLNKIKKIITQTQDEYIAMYGKQMTKQSRIAVMLGTTNDAKPLRDMTGNRRFPIIAVTKELEFAAVDAEKDQIWAEAVFLEAVWGDLRLSSDSFKEMEAGQRNAMDYEEGVHELLDELDELGHGFIAAHTLRECFGIDASRGRLADASKARHALNQIKARLLATGWQETPNPIRIGGKRLRGLYKADLLGDIVPIVYSNINGLHHSPEDIQT